MSVAFSLLVMTAGATALIPAIPDRPICRRHTFQLEYTYEWSVSLTPLSVPSDIGDGDISFKHS